MFVLIDALGWKYLEGRQFLNEELPYRQPLRTVLGFSSGAIPTILTGVFPSQHGHWNLFYYDPVRSPFKFLRLFGFLPDYLLDNRLTRKTVKELGRKIMGMGPLFECCVSPRLMPFFNWVERRNIYDYGGITGAASIFDTLQKRGVSHRIYTYHDATDANILRQAESDIRQGNAQFYFVYLSEMDMFLHMNCNDSGKIQDRLRWYEEGVSQLISAARSRDASFTFSITSDHGMTPVHDRFDLVGEVEKLGLRMPGDYLVVYDSTMARFWFFNDAARGKIVQTLSKISCGRVLSDSELKSLGIYFEDRRYGEAIFLLSPGWMISKGDFNGPSWMPSGMHGYDPFDSYSDAIYLSNRKPSSPMTAVQQVHDRMVEAAGVRE
ncbi:MAG TPA: alkaline phosphatase family protein [Candidatus Acidoferrales bacterium]|nr:alkaline phosphatase family protein [Candidatus Acidoferrales bacterium]